ncbi:MAG: hypothetical protein ACRDSJ_22620, partial [Rubrobacteraceae bacterium]
MEEKGRKGRRFRLRFVLLLVLIVVAVLGVIFRPAISAQYRAAIVLSSVLEPPVLTPLAETLTNEPTIEETTITGVPTLVARPGGEGPYPALVFMNGAVPPGNDEPTVRRLARGLARAGYA